MAFVNFASCSSSKETLPKFSVHYLFKCFGSIPFIQEDILLLYSINYLLLTFNDSSHPIASASLSSAREHLTYNMRYKSYIKTSLSLFYCPEEHHGNLKSCLPSPLFLVSVRRLDFVGDSHETGFLHHKCYLIIVLVLPFLENVACLHGCQTRLYLKLLKNV